MLKTAERGRGLVHVFVRITLFTINYTQLQLPFFMQYIPYEELCLLMTCIVKFFYVPKSHGYDRSEC
jgi:hypothetical protein